MKNTAKILRNNVSEIMNAWQQEVIDEVPAAREANAIALFDHLPNIITDIADLLDRHSNLEDISKDETYKEIIENSRHHGRHRATSEEYTVEQVVHEYIIFHRKLSEFINDQNAYDQQISDLIKYVIETSILKSVGSFSRSIQEMQEKLIGTIAHDIRNPLSAAQLSLKMIEEDTDGTWTDRARVAAQRSVDKALSLIEGLMNGITVKAGEGLLLSFEETNLVRDILVVFEESKEVYTREIILNCDQDVVQGIFDSTAVRRMLENLISNAVKYGDSSQPVTVTIENQDDSVLLKVHNHGEPIPQDKQDDIFNFMTTAVDDQTSIAGSWGMGLTLAQIVAEAHGGDIKLTSSQDEGTTFEIILIKEANEPGKRRAKLMYNADEIVQEHEQ